MTGAEAYRRATIAFSVVILGFGLATIVRSIAAGAGPLSAGILLGVLFSLLGAGRLTIALRSTP